MELHPRNSLLDRGLDAIEKHYRRLAEYLELGYEPGEGPAVADYLVVERSGSRNLLADIVY